MDARRADFHSADLSGARLVGGHFNDASFHSANLSGADLSHSDFSGADFHDANLEGARFFGADLASARGLTEDQLQSACVDATTRLPPALSAARGCHGHFEFHFHFQPPQPPQPPVPPSPTALVRHFMGE